MSMSRCQFISALMILGLVACVLVLAPGEAHAAAGGVFLKAAVKTWWGKALLAILGVVLFPLIAYYSWQDWRSRRRNLRDLNELAAKYPNFAWPDIEDRARRCFKAVYEKWTEGDLSPARGFLTDDYLQSQQDMLDRWRDEGKRNVVKLESKPKLRALQVEVEDAGAPSMVSILITVGLVDYLEDIADGKVHKGRKRVKSGHESIWNFVYEAGEWRLNAIEDGSDHFTVMDRKNRLDTTYLDRKMAQAPASAAQAAPEAESEPSAESECREG